MIFTGAGFSRSLRWGLKNQPADRLRPLFGGYGSLAQRKPMSLPMYDGAVLSRKAAWKPGAVFSFQDPPRMEQREDVMWHGVSG